MCSQEERTEWAELMAYQWFADPSLASLQVKWQHCMNSNKEHGRTALDLLSDRCVWIIKVARQNYKASSSQDSSHYYYMCINLFFLKLALLEPFNTFTFCKAATAQALTPLEFCRTMPAPHLAQYMEHSYCIMGAGLFVCCFHFCLAMT